MRQVLRPQPAARHGEGFASAEQLAEVSLLGGAITVHKGNHPVALEVGYIDSPPAERGVRPLRKQVVVIITASFHVLCFDHNLKLLWQHTLESELPANARMREVALYVSHHQVSAGDRGLVVVGTSVETGDLRPQEHDDDYEDVLADEERFERGKAGHAKSFNENGELEEVDNKTATHGVSTSRHFNYFAYEGGVGDLRWHHNSGDFVHNLDELADASHRPHDFRIDAEAVEGRHFGEASCRDYRESVLHVLPHSWASRRDTWLEEAHFVRHKEGRGAQKAALAEQGSKAAGGALGRPAPTKASALGGLLSTSGSGGGGSTGRKVSSAALPHHHKHASRQASRASRTTGFSPRKHHNYTANAIVAHLADGIEVVHLFSGRPICKLSLPREELHADINADGVVDHVMVYRGNIDPRIERDAVHGHVTAHHDAPTHCTSIVKSGIPPRELLFKASACTTKHSKLAARLAAVRRDAGHGSFELMLPVLLPMARLGGGYGSLQRMHDMVLFMTTKGEVTAVNHKGDFLWRQMLPIGANLPEESGVHAVGTFEAMSMRRHSVPTAVLASGVKNAVILSEHGRTLESVVLPYPPTTPIQIMDFNGDGLNDLVVVTQHGTFGYAQVHHMGGVTLSAMLLTLIIAMGVVWYTQIGAHEGLAAGGGKKAKVLRSTDYTD